MTPTVVQKIVRTREFTVSGMDDVQRLMRELKQDRFTGRVVVHMNMGGINSVHTEDSQQLNGKG